MAAQEEEQTTVAVLKERVDHLIRDVGSIKAATEQIAESMVRIAVVEERHASTSEALTRAFKAIGKLDGRVTKIEQQPGKWADRAVQAAITAIVASVVAMVVGKSVVVGGERSVAVTPSAHAAGVRR